MEEFKKTVQELEEVVQTARTKQESSEADIKRIKKDMAEFKNNKEGKIDELKVHFSSHVSTWLII